MITPDSKQAAAFYKRLLTFASKEDSRQSICGTAAHVAPMVWAATDGHRCGLIPVPDSLQAWDLSVPINADKPWPIQPLLDGAKLGAIPTYCTDRKCMLVQGEPVHCLDNHFPMVAKVIKFAMGPGRFDLPDLKRLCAEVDTAIAKLKADKALTPAQIVKLRACGHKPPASMVRIEREPILRIWSDGRGASRWAITTWQSDWEQDEPGEDGKPGLCRVLTDFARWIGTGATASGAILTDKDDPTMLGLTCVGVNFIFLKQACEAGDWEEGTVIDNHTPLMIRCGKEANVLMPMRL